MSSRVLLNLLNMFGKRNKSEAYDKKSMPFQTFFFYCSKLEIKLSGN